VGSTFKVYLPLVEGEATARADDATGEAIPTGRETILLVEDDESLRAMIGETLRGLGYTVLEAASPAQALARMDHEPMTVDLLLTDVVMPGMGGRDLARGLAPGRPGMKTLYMSGYTDDAIVRHGVLEPGIAFLGKPFTSAALARKVRDVLEPA
jgi:CheY-like chemotaxis protein